MVAPIGPPTPLTDPILDPVGHILQRLINVEREVADIRSVSAPRTWVRLAQSNLASPAAMIDFQNIIQTYAHLRVVGMIRTDRAAVTDGLKLNANNDGGNYYDWVWGDMRYGGGGAGATVWYSNDGQGTAYAELGFFPAQNAPEKVFGPFELSIPHYTSLDVHKSMWLVGGHLSTWSSQNLYFNVAFAQYSISPPTAITRLTFRPVFGSNFAIGSRITIYGLA